MDNQKRYCHNNLACPVSHMVKLINIARQFITALPFTEYAIYSDGEWKWMTPPDINERLEQVGYIRAEKYGHADRDKITIPLAEYRELNEIKGRYWAHKAMEEIGSAKTSAEICKIIKEYTRKCYELQ